MISRFAFVSVDPSAPHEERVAAAMKWIAAHCRKVAKAHMAIADKADGLLRKFIDNRRFRTGLRTFARHHRRAAWQHLEMACRAEAARRADCEEFDLVDILST